MSIVTLVSGGLDSTLMSLLAHEEGVGLAPLFIDYGQLGATREWQACKLLHERHGLPPVIRMDVAGFGKVVPSGITNTEMRITWRHSYQGVTFFCYFAVRLTHTVFRQTA
jgi:7-cyano-7-deazaguanine synthase